MYFKRLPRVRTKSALREGYRAGFNDIFYFSQSQNHSLSMSEDNCLRFNDFGHLLRVLFKPHTGKILIL